MDDIDYKRLLKEFGMMLLAFVVSMVICGVIGMLTSCKSVKYIPVPEYHTEYKVKTDSVRVPYPVEKELSKWEETKMNLFIPIALLCVVFFVTLLWLIKRRL